MKIGIYNPYFATLGGGEQYVLTIASSLSRHHDVNIFWEDTTLLSRASDRFHLDLSTVHTVPDVWNVKNRLEKLHVSKMYDCLFIVSDGSIPLTACKNTILIFQFPMPGFSTTFLTRWKLKRMKAIICYSQFVQKYLEHMLNLPVQVIAPSIDAKQFVANKKEKVILSTGRFTTGNNRKKQEILIDIFKTYSHSVLKNWTLVLAGGAREEDDAFVKKLQQKAKGLSIRIMPNCSFSELRDLYGKATLYWHAAGFGEDIDIHPEYAEHFGITILEAMAAQAVPLVFNAGGPAEIITEHIDGEVWKTEEELMEKTQDLIQDSEKRLRMQKAGLEKVQQYTQENMMRKITNLIEITS